MLPQKRRRTAHNSPDAPQSSSSKTHVPGDTSSAVAIRQCTPEEVIPDARIVAELASLIPQAPSEATHAQTVVSDLRHQGHNYYKCVVTENARANFGNVYNFSQPSFSVTDDSKKPDGPDLMKILSFDGMSDHLTNVTPAHAETCSWILDRPEYIKWRDHSQRFSHHGVLWIKGKAGTGNSTLMGCLYDHVRQHDCEGIAVSFFFNARSPDQLLKSTEGMYRCLLHQILTHLPRLSEGLSQLQVPKEGEAWPIARLESAFRIAILDLSAKERITCFVDALDECKMEDVRKAVEYFEDLVESVASKNIQFRICFSSRYYPLITMRRHEELKLDAQFEHMNDISRYIDNKLIVREGAKLELSSKMYARCSGIFLWVVLVVQQLREAGDTGCTRSTACLIRTFLKGFLCNR